jgi:2-succinyl-6-hydroxy-2,4-cyclohexadiene-1-carboxylate synthase
MSAPPEPGPPTGRLVFLHGFTQTHHHWHHCADLIADRLADRPTLAFVDLPGHGLSNRDLTEIAASGPPIVELAGQGTYIGYSMGGRFALAAALARWGIVERLVLIGATPGIENDAERYERHRLDRERADRIETIGIEPFLDEWLAAPMFANLPHSEHDLEHRRRNYVTGLAHSLRWCGTGNQAPMWQHLERIPIPILVIAGELDTKFTEIGRRMTDALPNATFVPIPGAGHAAHTERPGATAGTIADWLQATSS